MITLHPGRRALDGIAVDEVERAYHDRGMARWSDAELASAAAEVIAVPKVAPADSFVLHAPLELLARRALLRHIRPDVRHLARQRLVGLAASYAAAGESLAGEPVGRFTSVGDAAWRLTGAIASGDLDDVDVAATALGRLATPDELAQYLAEPVVASLAAAAHASILFDLLPRVAAAGEITGTLVRGPARELARNAGWQLHWFEDPDDPVVAGSLADMLLDVPRLGEPGSNFIHPIMRQAEESGLAPRMLSGLLADGSLRAVGQVRRELARIAAWSMLQEPSKHAPYGWTHCLTMPQSVMALAEAGRYQHPEIATAVAATYVVGFRSALGQCDLSGDLAPPRSPAADLEDALSAGREEAAAWVWHAPAGEVRQVRTQLATCAALHHDAHLVKYTLACFDAATNDPARERLFLAAGASLHAWWLAEDAACG